MKTKIITSLGSTAAIALLLAACGGEGGNGGTGATSSTSPGTGGGSACGSLVWSSTSASCSACMSASCCAALSACDAGTPCGTLIGCVRDCAPGDSNCVTSCQTTHAAGQPAVDTLLACYDANCKGSSACGAQVCDTGVSVPDQGCGDCLTTNCCDPWRLCAQDSACLDCLVNPAACGSNTLYQSALACQNGSCGSLCATRICDTTLGYPDAPACNYCLGQAGAMGGCCEETQACSADKTCLDCITGKTTAGCSTNAAYTGFTSCQKQKCGMECGTGGG